MSSGPVAEFDFLEAAYCANEVLRSAEARLSEAIDQSYATIHSGEVTQKESATALIAAHVELSDLRRQVPRELGFIVRAVLRPN